MKTWLPTLLTTVLLALTAHFAIAQPAAKIPQIGYLNVPVREGQRHLSEGFRQGLRELGYVEGQNIIVTERIGEEPQLPSLAADLVRLKMDVIVAQARAIPAAMSATTKTPIVAAFTSDPVLNGMVRSLAGPGGNVTGVGALTPDLGGKWLELIRETVPSAKQVAVFWNKTAEDSFPLWKSVESTARSLRVDLRWEAVGPTDTPPVYQRLRTAAMSQEDAFLVLPGVGGIGVLDAIADFGLRNRIPGIFGRSDLDIAQMGGLMIYRVNQFEQSRRVAYVMDKILKGAKPAQLPVELPRSFELVINLKAAKEIGVSIPPRVLAWADRVIK